MIEKFLLLLGGSLIGCLLTVPVYLYLRTPDNRQSFENLDQLRTQLSSRDERDVKSDGSLSLRSIVLADEQDDIIYRLAPNLKVKFQGVDVSTNSFGMRGPEVKLEKAEDTFRIALIGDSFAFGWGVEEKDSFARVIERELTTRLSDKSLDFDRAEVLNFGTPGYSTFQEVALYEKSGSRFKPDLVLVYYVDNDFGLPFFIRDLSTENSLMSGSVFARLSWKRNNDVIEKQRQQMVDLVNPNNALKRLDKIMADSGSIATVVINPNHTHDRELKRLWALKDLEHVNRLGIRADYMRYLAQFDIDPSTLSLPDDPHPNAAKHHILGKLMADKIYQRYLLNLKGLKARRKNKQL